MSCQLKKALTSVQVPRSSKVVAEDNDNALFTVTLFRRVADTFKTAARTRGFQVTAHMHTLLHYLVSNLTRSFVLQPLHTMPCVVHQILCKSCIGQRACSTLHCMLLHALPIRPGLSSTQLGCCSYDVNKNVQLSKTAE